MVKRTWSKLFAVLMVMALVVGALPGAVLAFEQESESAVTQPNPNYDVTPIELNVVTIAPGPHNVAIDDEGSVFTWGAGGHGQLGDGTYETYKGLTKVELPDRAIAVDRGVSFSVALLENGRVYAWGEIEPFVNTDHSLPQLVEGIENVVEVKAADQSIFAITQNGEVWVWGQNVHNSLGLGSNVQISEHPTQLLGLENDVVESIFVLNNSYFALMRNGSIKAWGNNKYGQLQIGLDIEQQSTPLLSELDDIKELNGSSNCLATSSNNDLLAWGENTYGALGIGSTNVITSPVVNDSVGKVKSVTGFSSHSVIVKDNGTVWSAGLNTGGLLGIGSSNTQYQAHNFVQVDGLEGAVQVEGDSHIYVQTANGDWWGWGINNLGLVTRRGELLPNGEQYNSVLDPVLIFSSTKPEPEGDHNVTIVVRYLDGIMEDQVSTHWVDDGAAFSEPYEVLDGYGLDMVTWARSTQNYHVDTINKLVNIASVTSDVTVLLEFEPIIFNVTVIVNYLDGALEETTERYTVPYGERFETTFEALDGYRVVDTSTSTLGVQVSNSRKSIVVDSVLENITVTVTLG